MEHVTTLVLVLQDMLEPGMCEHIYAPMSTIKQSLEVVMSGQVETLRVSFNSVEWQLGNTPPLMGAQLLSHPEGVTLEGGTPCRQI